MYSVLFSIQSNRLLVVRFCGFFVTGFLRETNPNPTLAGGLFADNVCDSERVFHEDLRCNRQAVHLSVGWWVEAKELTPSKSARFSDETGKRCFSNWRIQDCLLAAGLMACWFAGSWLWVKKGGNTIPKKIIGEKGKQAKTCCFLGFI